jgi:glucose/arabinose dehydrogenase/cytochrome c551/c552
MELSGIALRAAWALAASPAPIGQDAGGPARPAAGLVARYRALDDTDGGTNLVRIEAKPALALGRGSPHPRLPPGPFAATWEGMLEVKRDEALRFGAFAGGEVEVVVGGAVALRGSGDHDAAWVAPAAAVGLRRGLHPLRVEFRALENVGARLQLWWEGESFSLEPIPAWRLRHDPAALDDAARSDLAAQRGHEAAGRLGCASCHRGALPAADDPPVGPSLADAGSRVTRVWLMEWLASPRAKRPGARMPELFAPDRTGFVERSLAADALVALTGGGPPPERTASGDHRAGRQEFLGLGCAACHFVPDVERSEQPDLGRSPIERIGERMTEEQLARFLLHPAARYPDGRMPQIPMPLGAARSIAAYLLRTAGASPAAAPDDSVSRPVAETPPTEQEVEAVATRLRVTRSEVGKALLREKGCGGCHPGLPEQEPKERAVRDVRSLAADPRGCLAQADSPARALAPRFALDEETRRALAAYLAVARRDAHPSAADARRRLLERSGCARCHRRDSDRPSPLEEVAPTLWTPMLYRLPFQKTPPLTFALRKYAAEYLTSAIRDGVFGVRPDWYSFRMPVFGALAGELVQALAEADGDLVDEPTRARARSSSEGTRPATRAGAESAPPPPAPTAAEAATSVEATAAPSNDPTLFSAGPELVGFSGYSCVSCHLWNGQNLTVVDPGAVGPELTTVTRRIRRDWFERWLEDPGRIHPGTVMPSFFKKGEETAARTLLASDVVRQREALWAYLSLGREAPAPRPRPPIALAPPADGEPNVAQIPLQVEGGTLVESICLYFGDGLRAPGRTEGGRDGAVLALFDVGAGSLRNVYAGAQLLRHPNGGRSYSLSGTALLPEPAAAAASQPPAPSGPERGERPAPPAPPPPPFLLVGPEGEAAPSAAEFRSFERRKDGASLRSTLRFATAAVDVVETLRLEATAPSERASGARGGTARRLVRELTFEGVPDGHWIESRAAPEAIVIPAPTPSPPPAPAEEPPASAALVDAAYTEGSLERPGYRAIRWPRPQTSSGEDLVMPAAIAVDPGSGRVFVASMKLGEIFEALDPDGTGRDARFEDFARGLFQDCFGLEHDGSALLVLHRRNLTRVTDEDGNGKADRFERVAPIRHAIGGAYDWGYGLARDRDGAFLLTLAPYGDQRLLGAGCVLRLAIGRDGARGEEIATGLRNAFGWCNGPEGEPFFTDNQGEWVASNKLCHVDAGRFYGWPNPARPPATSAPKLEPENACVWIPYAWAKSVNGVAHDSTGGGFGPFAGQLFLAELMHGGRLLRANVEKVKGVWQGACFPFWGQGLLGPLCLAFDPRGPLYVGGITMPGWMGQPDRGAFHRIEFTGETPFEIRSLHARPDGFRAVFTRPAEPASALAPDSWSVERYHYEYTGAYGSPELERAPVPIRSIRLSGDACAADLCLAELRRRWVYTISAPGARSPAGEPLLHPTGAYTLNEIPDASPE